MDELYTIREVAEKLKISTSSVYRYIESGRLQHVRIGSNIRLNKDHVTAFLSGEKQSKDDKTSNSFIDYQTFYDQF